MLRLWRIYRPQPGRIGGMAAGYVPVVGHMAEPGGTLDQGSWLMDAFQILTSAELEAER